MINKYVLYRKQLADMASRGYSNVSPGRLELYALVGPEIFETIERTVLDYVMLEAHFVGLDYKSKRFDALAQNLFEEAYASLSKMYKDILKNKAVESVLRFKPISRNDMWKEIKKKYGGRISRL